MRDIYLTSSMLPYGCGLETIGQFKYDYNQWEHDSEDVTIETWKPENTGYFAVAYIDDEICAEVEAYLGAKFKVVFESERRVNGNSNNMFKFVIYDAGDVNA